MKNKQLVATLALCLIACLSIMVFADLAHAQGGEKAAKSSDKKTATRTGVSGSLADGPKKDGEMEGPTKTQMAIGVGSFFVMIAVVKWL
jgi:hypothetical protein